MEKGGNYVGGIAGYLHATRSDDVTLFGGNKNFGEISGKNYVGGVFGSFVVQNTANSYTITIKDNSNEGIITAYENYAGGIFGFASGEFHSTGYNAGYKEHLAKVKIIECKNNATVNGNDYVGGILGQGAKYMITDQVVWETNTVSGNISATGEHKGEYYGAIA